MIGKLLGAAIGNRMSGPDHRVRGTMIGAAVPWVLRRVVSPLGLLVIGGFAAKKIYDATRGSGEASA